MLSIEEREVLEHTLHRAANRMYCCSMDDEIVSVLVARGLMEPAGRPDWLPENSSYYTITPAGRKALEEEGD